MRLNIKFCFSLIIYNNEAKIIDANENNGFNLKGTHAIQKYYTDR